MNDWVDMEYFAHYHEEYLKKYMELKNGIPSHDTLCRVFGMLSPEVLQQLYRKWQELLNKMVEILRPNLSMKKKRFVISMNPAEFLEQVLSFIKEITRK